MKYPIQIQEVDPITIADMVSKDYRTAEVFKKFGLDFCCGGKKSIQAACKEKHIDYQALSNALEEVRNKPQTETLDFNQWDVVRLVDYIVEVHHAYVQENLVLIETFLSKVLRVHGDANPELHEVSKHFLQVANELNMHMLKEERILFPYIKELWNADAKGEASNKPMFGTIRNPIHNMEHEHEIAGQEMAIIRTLTSNYRPPEYACNTYRVLYFKLEEFENDLHKHVHLENNILFPKSIALEACVGV